MVPAQIQPRPGVSFINPWFDFANSTIPLLPGLQIHP